MSRPPGILDQSVGVGGSCTQLDALDISEEPLSLGKVVAGQSGASASISAVVGSVVTMTGLTGLTGDSVGRCITVSDSATLGNSGTFNISAVFGGTTINYENALAVAPDGNNGAISWIEREPYSLEDDINYTRTDRKLIKGTANWYDPIPTYVRPTDTLTDVDANLTNIAGNTLDARAFIDSHFQESVSVSAGNEFITLIDVGNLKHADSVDTTGVPIIDGYDAGNFRQAFVVITDGYGAGLQVLNGTNTGDMVVGMTREGSSTSPDSVEVVFYSVERGDLDLSSLSLYTWESAQPSIINVCFGFRDLLSDIEETALRSSLIKNALKVGSGGGSLPTPDEECQVLYAVSPTAFTSELPLTSPNGWLVNDDGCLLVIG